MRRARLVGATVFVTMLMACSSSPGSSGDENLLGQECTVGSDAQGSCPAGYVCNDLPGLSTHPWCTKICTMGSGDTCGSGYSGPGHAECLIVETMGSSSVNVCGIVCAQVGSSNLCPSGEGECTDSCPDGLECNGTISENGSTLGSACQ
jgi:hypothetical protein